MVSAVTSSARLAPAYDAIVIGSGYGGGVAASRLARMGLSVVVLEQGRLWRPGDFPTTAKARRQTTRVTGRFNIGDPTGLYALSVGKGLTVFGAQGLGGSSLINAGVAIWPDQSRLRKAGWPTEVFDDGLFAEGLTRGEAMLGVGPVPEPERFAKYRGMRRAAEASGRAVIPTVMTIAHKPGPNSAGVMQYACRHCGDCWSGCNLGAKITTAVTYITDAIDHGATIACEARVEALAKTASGWEVTVTDLTSAKVDRRIAARIVVVAAGTMGSNELMLRARARGLSLSDRLGQGFSANGDDLVFAGELPEPVNAVALGHPSQAPRGTPPVGPHSMAVIDLADADGPCWVHDGTMLTLMAALAPLKELLSANPVRALKLLRGGIYGEMLSRSQPIYIVASDDASGRLSLQKDRVVVEWPSYSAAPQRIRAEAKAKALIEKAGGRFTPNPLAMTAFGGNRIIAHPLGGCGMGENAESGVVTHDGRVFDPSAGPTAVHDGLYVLDGAQMPTAVGASPLITITALAERAMTLAARRLDRPLDVTTSPPRPLRDAAM